MTKAARTDGLATTTTSAEGDAMTDRLPRRDETPTACEPSGADPGAAQLKELDDALDKLGTAITELRNAEELLQDARTDLQTARDDAQSKLVNALAAAARADGLDLPAALTAVGILSVDVTP